MALPRFYLFGSALLVFVLAKSSLPAADLAVYFGTHNGGAGHGFSLGHFNTDTGALTVPSFLIQSDGPAYFQIHPDGKHLYTCNGKGTKTEGAISAYAIDPATGALTVLNSKPSGGADPSYISFDKTGRYVFVANYNGGNLAVYSILPDGSLGERTAFDQHTGTSVTPDRTQQAYAHCIITDPSNKFVLCTDLGLDRVYVYKFDEKTGALTPNDPAFLTDAPGSGPRHILFHPNGKIVYLVHEIANTVTVFSWDGVKGVLAPLQTISTLPADYKGLSNCAEMQISADGRFLYASNRTSSSIALFNIDPVTNLLTFVETVPTPGKMPRNFTFDPTGKWIVCTCHDTNKAIVYSVDTKTGKLTQAGPLVDVPYPFCERFFALTESKPAEKTPTGSSAEAPTTSTVK